MTRQDVNQALLQTSFLYGANGAYIEALQAQYEKDPLSVEPGWRDFFAALGDDPASVDEDRGGRFVEEAQLAADAQGRPDQRARRRLAGDGEGGRREAARQGASRRRRRRRRARTRSAARPAIPCAR